MVFFLGVGGPPLVLISKRSKVKDYFFFLSFSYNVFGQPSKSSETDF